VEELVGPVDWFERSKIFMNVGQESGVHQLLISPPRAERVKISN